MSYIEWKNEYSVGINSIDAQHKKLFGMVNKLHVSMKQGKSRDILSELINELTDYTIYHFNLEQENMLKTKFSGYPVHKMEHDSFAKKIRDFQTSYNLQSAIVSIELLHFLKDWLIKHVLGTDKNYSQHFIKNKII